LYVVVNTISNIHYAVGGGVFGGGIYSNGYYSGGYISWTSGDLGGGSTTQLSVTAVNPGTLPSSVNDGVTASVTTYYPDPNIVNNQASASFTTVGIPMLSTIAMFILVCVIMYAFHRRRGQLVQHGPAT
jgi:hypothetical protein